MNLNPYPEGPHAKTQRRKGGDELGSQEARKPPVFSSCLRAFVPSCEIFPVWKTAKIRSVVESSKAVPAFAPLRLRVRMAFVCLLMLLAFAGAARAEDASALVTLSSETTTVGEAVELQIRIQGTQKASEPELRVDGLQIQHTGASQQFQMNNLDITRSVVHTYTVLPLKEGTFTIPALSIDAGGKKLATRPVTLTVGRGQGGGAGQPGGPPGQSAGTGTDKFAWVEWVLPKTTAYVGEAIPAELRLYVDARVQCQLQQFQPPSGDGFTIQKMTQGQQRQITKDGRVLETVIFKTAITPVKDGKIALPSPDMNAVAVIPTKRPRTPRMPGFDQMLNDPFGAFNMAQNVKISGDPAELEIKPLPAAGKPRNFSGAVGQFTMEPPKANPTQVRVGDPVTITMVVKGIGSFDRVNAPVVSTEQGWQVYPPSGKFQADDEVGISGAKTFEVAAIPEAGKTELPSIEFSFFNPSTEKYETLTSPRIPVTVQGAPAVPSMQGTVAAGSPSTTPTTAAAPQPADIQYIRVDSGLWGIGFEPVWNTLNFWLAQLLPFSALLVLSSVQLRRARQNESTRRAARLRQSKAEAFRVLRDEKAAADAFYNAAIRAIQSETALGQLRSEFDPYTVDAEQACASRPLACETAEGIRHIFAAHDQLRYAGVGYGGSSSEPVYADQREQVLQILAQFEKGHA